MHLTERMRHIVQLLAEEFDKTQGPWDVIMHGDGDGPPSWDWRVEFPEDTYEANPETNIADVIPIFKVRDDQ